MKDYLFFQEKFSKETKNLLKSCKSNGKEEVDDEESPDEAIHDFWYHLEQNFCNFPQLLIIILLKKLSTIINVEQFTESHNKTHLA